MGKLNINYKKITEYFQRIAGRFPVTLVLIILTSVTASVFIDQDGDLGAFMESKGIPFLLLWGTGTFFTETLLREKKVWNWGGIIAAGLAAGCQVYLSNYGTEPGMERTSHWITAYVIVMITMGVYGNYKKSGLAFNEFCLRVVHELARLGIICSVTGGGIAMVMAVFVTLLLNGEHYMLIMRAEFLVLGCLTGSGLLNALIRMDPKMSRFFTFIVKYLMMVLLLAAFGVIYIYILKIVITRVVPSNEIFRILAGLFIIGLPIWTLAGTFEQDHWLVRIGTKLPYVFIPFLFLQGYAIRERIDQFGMTPSRYLCLVLMVFEVIYILVYALRKRETGIMLPVIAVLAVISCALPFVNMYSTAVRSQKAIFDRYINADFHALPSDERSRLAGAYYYLAGSEEGKAAIAAAAPEKIEVIKASGVTGFPEYDRNSYIYYDFPVNDADISEFDSMTMLSTFSFQNEKQPERIDPQRVTFYDSAGNKMLEADISRFINACISAYAENQTDLPDLSTRVLLPDGSILMVYHCGMTVQPENVISYIDINGILFK